MAAQTRKVERKGWSEALAEWWETLATYYPYGQDEIIGGIQDALTEARAERKARQQTENRS